MSGMMGYSFLGSGLPKMCYNTAKNWQLNWFEDKHETVNPLNDNFWEGDLIGYSDYQNPNVSSESKVILKIEGHEQDYFVGFNRKSGINIQNQEAGADNKVTVHSTSTSGESELEAKLTIGEMFEIPLFGQTDQSVLIQVENIDMIANPAVARVSAVTYMKCVSDADCDDGSSCTTDTCNLTTGKCMHTPNDLCSNFMEMILHTDQYPAETSWSIIDNCKDDDNVVMSGSGYKNTFSIYEKSINVPPSQYTLKIDDLYGDGICCGQGDGHFTVKINNENVLEGGKFGSTLEHTWGSCKVETAAPTPSPTVPPTEAPSSSPTACEMSYELTFRARTYSDISAPASWKFSYDEDLSIIGESSAGMMYHSGASYTESGCLKSNCYHFDINGAESYSLVIDGEELASGTDIYEPETSLFGTCQSMS
jgi:hypothetical protein